MKLGKLSHTGYSNCPEQQNVLEKINVKVIKNIPFSEPETNSHSPEQVHS